MREISYADAIREALREEMQKDKDMLIIGEEVGLTGGTFAVTKGLLDEFPGRVIDMPISEAAIGGVACGAAICGTKVCAEFMFMDFIFIGMDQVVNSAGKLRYMTGGQVKIPVVYRTASGTGISGAAQHSQSLEVLFCNIPGLKVIMPSTPYDAKGLLKSALNDNNPVIFIEPKALYSVKGPVPKEEYYIPIGKGEIKKEGKDATIIATGLMVGKSINVAKKLEEDGLSVEVLDLRTLSPLDEEIIAESVKKTGKVLVVHEAPRRYGIAGEIIAVINELVFDYLDAPPMRLGGLDVPTPFNRHLEKSSIPQEDDIYNAVTSLLQ